MRPSSNVPNSSKPISVHPQLKRVLDGIFAFSPNRDTLGGTSYLILSPNGNILIDCPPWNATTQAIIQEKNGIQWLIFTHRGGMGNPSHVRQIQDHFQCSILVQEQEAYLLPDVEVKTFQNTFQLLPTSQMIWTPGHTPGSSCFHHQVQCEGQVPQGILFTGRHLLPNVQGQMQPLRVAKTFHWGRQLRSLKTLTDLFTKDTLHFGCPGANIGFLRKQTMVPHFYQRLTELDIQALTAVKSGF